MRTVKTILIFIVLVLLVCAGLIYSGVYNVAADEPHVGVVRGVLGITRSRSIAVRLDNINPPDDLRDAQRIERGGQLYGDNCVACHLGPGEEETGVYQGLNPQPPELAAHGGHHSAREQFWVIKHGIRMTGMPAWGESLSDEELWDLTAFVMQLPDMPENEFRRYTRDEPEDS